jgi:tetratricopeptide (TPR) repeat protein
MAERFLFTPSLGFCIIVGLALVKIFKIDLISNKKAGLVPLYATLGIIIFLYSFKTIDRNTDWQDNDHLFKTDAQNMPNSFRLHNNEGIVLKLRSENVIDPAAKSELLSEAVSEYKKSIAIYPRQGAIWYDMGVCYYNLKDMADAENAFKHCLKYDTTNLSAINDIGVIFFNQQNYDSAYYFFNRTLQLAPKDAVALLNIGVIMVNKGNYDEAIKYYERSVALNPNNPNVYDNLIQVYNLKKDYAKADYYRTKRESLR